MFFSCCGTSKATQATPTPIPKLFQVPEETRRKVGKHLLAPKVRATTVIIASSVGRQCGATEEYGMTIFLSHLVLTAVQWCLGRTPACSEDVARACVASPGIQCTVKMIPISLENDAFQETSEALLDTAARIEKNRPWYETVGLRYYEEAEEHGADVAVGVLLTWNVAQGFINAAAEVPLVAPAFEIIKSLITAAQGAAEVTDEALTLIEYCTSISRCVLQQLQNAVIPDRVVETIEAIHKDLLDVQKFVDKIETQSTCYKFVLHGAQKEEADGYKQNLEEKLDLMMAGLMLDRYLANLPPPKIASSPPGAPKSPDYHVKRSVSDDILTKLTDATDGAPKIHRLWGAAGRGKSVLASWLVHDENVRHAFRHGIFWVSLGGKARENLALILEELVPRIAKAEEFEIGQGDWLHGFTDAKEVIGHLDLARKDHKYLLVLDNLSDMSVVDAFEGTGFHLLVTTRIDLSNPDSRPGTITEVQGMTDDEALEVLDAGNFQGTDRDAAIEVATYCEKLPLALALARELRRYGELSWAGLCTELEEARKKFEKENLGDEARVVFSAMDAFFHRLPGRHRRQLQLMLVVAPHVPVTREMLVKLWDTDPTNVPTTTKTLQEHSILQKVANGHHLHALELEYLRLITKDKEIIDTAVKRQLQYLTRPGVLQRFRDDGKVIGGGLYAFVDLWKSVIERGGGNVDIEASYNGSLRRVTEEGAFREAGFLLKYLGHDATAENMLKKARGIIQDNIANKGGMANILQDQEQSQKAVHLLEKILAITRTIPPPGHHAIGLAQKDLEDARRKALQGTPISSP